MESIFEIRLLTTSGLDGSIGAASEAAVIIAGRDRLGPAGWGEATPGNPWIGRPPEEVIGAGSPFLAEEVAHVALVAVCSCGFPECAALAATIGRRGDCVVWDGFTAITNGTMHGKSVPIGPFEFDAVAYESMVLDPVAITDWQATSRRVAHLVNERLGSDPRPEAAPRTRFAGAQHHGDDSVKVSAFFGSRGDSDRAILSRRFAITSGEDAAAVVDRIVEGFANGALSPTDRLVERRTLG